MVPHGTAGVILRLKDEEQWLIWKHAAQPQGDRSAHSRGIAEPNPRRVDLCGLGDGCARGPATSGQQEQGGTARHDIVCPLRCETASA